MNLRTVRVNVLSSRKILKRLLVLLLLHQYVAYPPVALIVPVVIHTQPLLKEVLRRLNVLNLHEFMPTQRKSKTVPRIDLNRPLEELNRRLMLILR